MCARISPERTTCPLSSRPDTGLFGIGKSSDLALKARPGRHLGAGIHQERDQLPGAAIGLDRQDQFGMHDKIPSSSQLPEGQGNFKSAHLPIPIRTSCRVSGGRFSRYWLASSQPTARISMP